MEQSISTQIIMYSIILFFCLLTTWGTLKELRKFRRLAKEGNIVIARIVGYETDNSGDTPTYPAVVTFKGPDGAIVTSKSKTSSSFKPKVGYEVEIVYDPESPGEFYFQKSSALYIVGLLCLGSIGGAGYTAVRLFELLSQ